MNDTMKSTTVCGLRGITEEDKIGWEDQTVIGGPHVDSNPHIGKHIYGVGPLGYDQHLLHVNSGSPVLGYTFDENGELYLTALIAGRPNLEEGDTLPEVAGGFAKVDTETGQRDLPKSGALRELLEETGFEPESITLTGGSPFIGDRAFFWKAVGEGNNVYMWELTDAQKEYIRLNRQLELLHWTDFIGETVDGITLGAIARVMMALHCNEIIKVAKA